MYIHSIILVSLIIAHYLRGLRWGVVISFFVPTFNLSWTPCIPRTCIPPADPAGGTRAGEMEGAKAKLSSKKQRAAVEESSGEDGALQIDVGKKGGGKKPGEGGKDGKAEEGWSVGDLVWAKVSGYVHWPAKVRLCPVL